MHRQDPANVATPAHAASWDRDMMPPPPPRQPGTGIEEKLQRSILESRGSRRPSVAAAQAEAMRRASAQTEAGR